MVQAKREPHLSRQACSTLFLKIELSQRALALTNRYKKDCVSEENRPPTSTPSTTKRALACLPTNSGYVVSLRRLALVTLAPSSTAARVGRPSLLRAQTRVVSTAS